MEPAEIVATPERTLATTGMDATGWLVMAGILLLGDGLLFATRRRSAAHSASR